MSTLRCQFRRNFMESIGPPHHPGAMGSRKILILIRPVILFKFVGLFISYRQIETMKGFCDVCRISTKDGSRSWLANESWCYINNVFFHLKMSSISGSEKCSKFSNYEVISSLPTYSSSSTCLIRYRKHFRLEHRRCCSHSYIFQVIRIYSNNEFSPFHRVCSTDQAQSGFFQNCVCSKCESF